MVYFIFQLTLFLVYFFCARISLSHRRTYFLFFFCLFVWCPVLHLLLRLIFQLSPRSCSIFFFFQNSLYSPGYFCSAFFVSRDCCFFLDLVGLHQVVECGQVSRGHLLDLLALHQIDELEHPEQLGRGHLLEGGVQAALLHLLIPHGSGINREDGESYSCNSVGQSFSNILDREIKICI